MNATSPSVQTAREHVAGVARASRSSFYWAMRLMPARRRAAMFAIYAYCRELDDIADSDAPAAQRHAGLDAWREEVARIWQGTPATPTGRALLEVRAAFPIRREDLIAVIDGVATDACGPVVRPSLAELDLYCDRVASAVGRLSVAVFGAVGEDGDALAHSLGRALQLTNILRDVDEDGGIGRLYLPDEALTRAGIAPAPPAQVLAAPGLPQACAIVAAMAGEHFAAARAALARCDRRAVRPAAVMLESYHRLLTRMERRGWQQRSPRMRLSRPEKLAIGIVHGLL
ncbi:MAG: presqualene diphosphate synthase HpnD [Proteobacteria bacterium]|nr:presqualene diphosphate synthase HpnD [Pseudomonadota bacterium]